MTGHWITVASLDHVETGIAAGIVQADHGRDTRLRRLERGDRIAVYSPKTAYEGGEPLQAFTAIGTIADDEPHRVRMSEGFEPWRRVVGWDAADHAPVRPLLEGLSFVTDVRRWGYPFHRGLFAATEADLELIGTAMSARAQSG